MQTSIVLLIICIGILAPLAFSGMNNPYAGIMIEITGLLKKRFKMRRKLGRFKNLSFREYEDRILRLIPYISDKDIKSKYLSLESKRRTKRLFS
jgi:hypothetical protein